MKLLFFILSSVLLLAEVTSNSLQTLQLILYQQKSHPVGNFPWNHPLTELPSVYTITKNKLGSGEYGEIYEVSVKNTNPTEKAAIKMPIIPTAQLWRNEKIAENSESIQNEINAFIDLKRKTPNLLENNIVDFLNFGTIDGKPFFVMSLLGPNLLKHGTFDVPLFKVLGRNLLKALRAIHMSGRLHLDIKLDNIAVGTEELNPKPKSTSTFKTEFYLCDFGLSVRWADEHGKHLPKSPNQKGRRVDINRFAILLTSVLNLRIESIKQWQYLFGKVELYPYETHLVVDECTKSNTPKEIQEIFRNLFDYLNNELFSSTKDLWDIEPNYTYLMGLFA